MSREGTTSSQEPHRTTEQKARIVLEVTGKPETSVLLASLFYGESLYFNARHSKRC